MLSSVDSQTISENIALSSSSSNTSRNNSIIGSEAYLPFINVNANSNLNHSFGGDSMSVGYMDKLEEDNESSNKFLNDKKENLRRTTVLQSSHQKTYNFKNALYGKMPNLSNTII